MREDQDFREKRMAETLGRALVEAIKGLLDEKNSANVGSIQQLEAPESKPEPVGSLDPSNPGAASFPPLEAPVSGAGGSQSSSRDESFGSTPISTVMDVIGHMSEVPQINIGERDGFDLYFPPVSAHPEVEVKPVEPPEPVELKMDPVARPRWELEPTVGFDAVGPVSSVDPLGTHRNIVDLDARTRTYDSSLTMLADQNLEYDERFRDYRRSEYGMLSRVAKDLAEDYRRLESLNRAFMTCRSTVTDANV